MEFKTIKENVQTEIVEKKSKFISNFFYVENINDAEDKIKEVKKKYHDAKHNCIAYRVLEDEKIVERASDDGEPSGTAGGPMLNILKKENLANVLIVVTRYFGGILLGTGGLVRAYSESLQEAISNSTIIEKCTGYIFKCVVAYNNFENFKYYCRKNNIKVADVNYEENIVCQIDLEEGKKEKLIDDYKDKKINLINLEDLYVKNIDKSI